MTCKTCGRQQQNLVFFCPTCGSRILECHVAGDLIVFTAGEWMSMRVAHYNDQPIEILLGASLDFQGLAVTGGGITVKIPLDNLYRQLQSASEVINL